MWAKYRSRKLPINKTKKVLAYSLLLSIFINLFSAFLPQTALAASYPTIDILDAYTADTYSNKKSVFSPGEQARYCISWKNTTTYSGNIKLIFWVNKPNYTKYYDFEESIYVSSGQSNTTCKQSDIYSDSETGQYQFVATAYVYNPYMTASEQVKTLFNIEAPQKLPSPTLNLPNNESYFNLQENINFSWGSINGANKYRFQIDTVPDFSNSTKTSIDTYNTSQMFQYVNVSAVGTHYWRVSAVSDKGTEGYWSETRKFYINNIKIDASISIDKTTVTAEPGTTSYFSLTIKNNGNWSDSYNVVVEAPTGWSYENIPLFSVGPNGSQSFNNRKITIPESALDGTYNITWKLTSENSSWKTVDSETTTITINKPKIYSADISVDKENQTIDTLWGDYISFNITIKNTGNTNDSYEVRRKFSCNPPVVKSYPDVLAGGVINAVDDIPVKDTEKCLYLSIYPTNTKIVWELYSKNNNAILDTAKVYLNIYNDFKKPNIIIEPNPIDEGETTYLKASIKNCSAVEGTLYLKVYDQTEKIYLEEIVNIQTGYLYFCQNINVSIEIPSSQTEAPGEYPLYYDYYFSPSGNQLTLESSFGNFIGNLKINKKSSIQRISVEDINDLITKNYAYSWREDRIDFIKNNTFLSFLNWIINLQEWINTVMDNLEEDKFTNELIIDKMIPVRIEQSENSNIYGESIKIISTNQNIEINRICDGKLKLDTTSAPCIDPSQSFDLYPGEVRDTLVYIKLKPGTPSKTIQSFKLKIESNNKETEEINLEIMPLADYLTFLISDPISCSVSYFIDLIDGLGKLGMFLTEKITNVNDYGNYYNEITNYTEKTIGQITTGEIKIEGIGGEIIDVLILNDLNTLTDGQTKQCEKLKSSYNVAGIITIFTKSTKTATVINHFKSSGIELEKISDINGLTKLKVIKTTKPITEDILSNTKNVVSSKGFRDAVELAMKDMPYEKAEKIRRLLSTNNNVGKHLDELLQKTGTLSEAQRQEVITNFLKSGVLQLEQEWPKIENVLEKLKSVKDKPNAENVIKLLQSLDVQEAYRLEHINNILEILIKFKNTKFDQYIDDFLSSPLFRSKQFSEKTKFILQKIDELKNVLKSEELLKLASSIDVLTNMKLADHLLYVTTKIKNWEQISKLLEIKQVYNELKNFRLDFVSLKKDSGEKILIKFRTKKIEELKNIFEQKEVSEIQTAIDDNSTKYIEIETTDIIGNTEKIIENVESQLLNASVQLDYAKKILTIYLDKPGAPKLNSHKADSGVIATNKQLISISGTADKITKELIVYENGIEKNITYKPGKSTAWSYTTTLSKEDPLKNISITAKNKSGMSSALEIKIIYDITKPKVKGSYSSKTKKVTLESNESGTIFYTLLDKNGKNITKEKTYSKPFTIENNVYTVKFYAIDKAGNKSNTGKLKIK